MKWPPISQMLNSEILLSYIQVSRVLIVIISHILSEHKFYFSKN